MQVAATTSLIAPTGNRAQTPGNMGSGDFINLLVAQLKNQSPFSPVNDKDFMAQMAQFSVLQQVQELNDHISSLVTLEQVTQAYSLIGKKVETMPDASGNTTTGVVTGVDLSGEKVAVTVGKSKVDVTDIDTVS